MLKKGNRMFSVLKSLALTRSNISIKKGWGLALRICTAAYHDESLSKQMKSFAPALLVARVWAKEQRLGTHGTGVYY